MPQLASKGQMSSPRNRKSKSPKSDSFRLKDAPTDLASRIRGLYRRVADQLGVDASYVSRVARSERRSKVVECALLHELNKIAENLNKQRDNPTRKAAREKGAKKNTQKRMRNTDLN